MNFDPFICQRRDKHKNVSHQQKHIIKIEKHKQSKVWNFDPCVIETKLKPKNKLNISRDQRHQIFNSRWNKQNQQTTIINHMRNETTEEPDYLSIWGESFDLSHPGKSWRRSPTERDNQQTTYKNNRSDIIKDMHIQEHNNRLPFNFKRDTQRELRRVEEDHRERGRREESPETTPPMRDTEGYAAEKSHRRRRRIAFRRRELERERERETRNRFLHPLVWWHMSLRGGAFHALRKRRVLDFYLFLIFFNWI